MTERFWRLSHDRTGNLHHWRGVRLDNVCRILLDVFKNNGKGD